jgi:hypothetical protein
MHLLFAGLTAWDLWHPLAGEGYQFWSGIGADLSEITVLGLALGAYKFVNCQSPRCWRFGLHRTADGHHKLCRRHHPGLPNHKLSLAEIHEMHHTAQRALAVETVAVAAENVTVSGLPAAASADHSADSRDPAAPA